MVIKRRLQTMQQAVKFHFQTFHFLTAKIIVYFHVLLQPVTASFSLNTEYVTGTVNVIVSKFLKLLESKLISVQFSSFFNTVSQL